MQALSYSTKSKEPIQIKPCGGFPQSEEVSPYASARGFEYTIVLVFNSSAHCDDNHKVLRIWIPFNFEPDAAHPIFHSSRNNSFRPRCETDGAFLARLGRFH